ncbi:dihydropteroate synthase [Psychrobium sp. 1_MG-2023]|uniref:dihydropteroate synthase n=1 Tax=Psychrobium sp. 1_MG-2023 TaxID=3062624 RepID=UPI000C349AD0|nr:dihydropteroate synthase [Psychrobium sp. 1_MG-2023]MDP2562679.1 dihydropteroate synthase [Psychrobium sp. 1_MG-2023]PKF54807.1 dihydropteroate synthase [Alteromonadales bacterium alter-6D02]
MQLYHKNKILKLDRPQVMGILNVTPDSFSDGGSFTQLDVALKQVDQMLGHGATIIDVGGESTRPGAAKVELSQELDRVVPIIEAIAERFDCWVSIDTSKAQVMTEAVAAGANLINDVRALQLPGALEAAATAQVPVCLMHMQGQPQTMQQAPQYDNVLLEVTAFFEQQVDRCVNAGIKREQIILDPGFGFGKTMEHNFSLVKHFAHFKQFNLPLLAGLSRKSMFEHLLAREVDERLAASLAGALLCAQQGAQIIRVHDVKETADVLKVLEATEQATIKIL